MLAYVNNTSGLGNISYLTPTNHTEKYTLPPNTRLNVNYQLQYALSKYYNNILNN